MSTAVELAEHTDRQLLDVMKNGVIVRDGDGSIVKGPDGQPLREAPSAALINAALKRIAQLGISGVPVGGSDLARLAKAAADRAAHGGKLSPVDTESSDAATG